MAVCSFIKLESDIEKEKEKKNSPVLEGAILLPGEGP